MPKSPTSTRAVLSPRLVTPYLRNDNNVKSIDFAGLDIGSPKCILSHPDSARDDKLPAEGHENIDPSVAQGCITSSSISTTTAADDHHHHHHHHPPSHTSTSIPLSSHVRLAISSTKVHESNNWTLKGDFLRNGIHVYSKSGKHVIEDPLSYDKNAKVPRWLQVQFNVVVLEESYWNCDIVLKDMGGLPCGKDVLIAVQTGGVSVDLKKGTYTMFLKPHPEDEDPRIAISYFIPYSEKHYIQAMDGELPYGFLLQRVSGKAEEKAKKRRNSKWRYRRDRFVDKLSRPVV